MPPAGHRASKRESSMSYRLDAGGSRDEKGLEDAMLLDEVTATYAAAFATLCTALGREEAAPGDEHVALRLAQQMRCAAAAYWAGEPLDDAVWVPADAREQ